MELEGMPVTRPNILKWAKAVLKEHPYTTSNRVGEDKVEKNSVRRILALVLERDAENHYDVELGARDLAETVIDLLCNGHVGFYNMTIDQLLDYIMREVVEEEGLYDFKDMKEFVEELFWADDDEEDVDEDE